MGLWADIPAERRRELTAVVLLALTVALFLCLVTDGYHGSVRRPMDGAEAPYNALGTPGTWVASFLYLLLGHAAHVVYFLVGAWGVTLLRNAPLDRKWSRALGTFALLAAVALLVQVNVASTPSNNLPGGVLGAFFADPLLPWFGYIGVNVIGITGFLVGLLLATEFLFIRLFEQAFRGALVLLGTLTVARQRVSAWQAERRTRRDTVREMRHKERMAEEAARRAEWEAKASSLPRADQPESAPASQSLDKTPPADGWPRIRVQYEGRGASAPFDAVPVPDAPDPIAPESPVPAPAARAEAPAAPDPWADWAKTLGPVGDDAGAERAETDAPSGAAPMDEDGAPDDAGEFPVEYADDDAELAAFEAADAGYSVSQETVPRAGRRKPMPRRKTAEFEDLPPDYQYPKHYVRPSIDLFDPAPPRKLFDIEAALRNTSLRLEDTLKTFGIEARVTDVMRGPTITRYELEPAPGIKVSRFLSLADDIALALKAHRVRVEAPIPGKGRVGIEVPNAQRDPVVLRDLLESPPFRQGSGQLNLALGKDIAGDVKVADLATMPHLLVAGATGAGKTVCVKALLASMLYARTPQELQLMLIDPKMVELSIFNDIPHLITPVVIDPKKAASALNWLINEMEERYRLFAHLRVRNIEVYNESVENGEIEMEGMDDGEADSMDAIRKLPYIVCVIDELADLMMLARAEVEDAIARLAQLARAVGIHLIIATQRPSVDVLTGVIKANFPARVSFQVSSRVDSRCILDEIGAERLIGRGDMLYLPAGQSKPTRIQGAFVSDDEMNRLIAYLKTQAPPQYRDEIARFGKSDEALGELDDQDDDLFDDAVRVVLETGQASISMVQRRLRVGYTRAARLIDMMEMRGIVGPHCGSKAREILVGMAPTDEVNAAK